ncbi:phosphatidate cytidylyltransferase [Aureococcus anophagefferens]|uniref:phosphatidate cytidylyltransferase n=1 Tax=Aureococcus anophagefferens TaxID=44056 RepID=A0ABR1FXB7_AURAN
MVELRQRKGSAKKAADGEQLSENGMLEEVRRSTEGEDKPAPAPATEPPAVMQQGFWKKFAVWAGHFYVCLLIMLLQTMAFREIVSVRYSEYKSVDGAGRLPLFRTLQWGWYYVALVFVYGDFIKEFAYSHERGQDVLLHYARHHEALAFAGYCLVFMLSVWTLTADNVKYQVGQLSWTIVTLCIVVGQMKFVAHNIFDGLFWFFFPAWLVINNDCWAYAWGAGQDKGDSTSLQRECSARAFWKKHPRFETWLVCPAAEITLVAHKTLSCETRAVFVKQAAYDVLGLFTLEGVAPIQLHAVCFALFASIVAPFGGFLASAIKRAYHVKDFDSIIPGHGGVTDRVDCEFIMALFVYVPRHASASTTSTGDASCRPPASSRPRTAARSSAPSRRASSPD